MKSKKLSLENLKVKSFVTKVEKTSSNTVKGGTSGALTGPAWCNGGSGGCQGTQGGVAHCFAE